MNPAPTVGAGLAAVMARMSDLQQRFAPPPGAFAAVLAQATGGAAPGAPAPASPQATGGTAPGASAPASPQVSAPAGPPPGSAAAPVAGAGVAWDWAARLPEEGRRWAPAIAAAAESAGVDPRLLAALVWAESGFRADAGSHAGAIGLTQLMPATAKGLGVDPHDPAGNLIGGARYLRAQLDRFGSPELALAAYNAGPGRVARAGGVPQIAETRAYVPRVLDYYSRLQ